MTIRSLALCAFAAVAAAVLAAAPVRADDEAITLTLKDHRFTPDTIEVPAGKKVKLLVKNEDSTAEEFDSYDLNREKIIPGGSQGIVFIGPLDPGTYAFMGEFNADTAQGKVIAK